MTSIACLSSAYLAPVSYYCKLYAYDKILLEQHEHYIKQTYRNRCVITSSGGPLQLSVPIERDDSSHTKISDIQISNHGNWRHLHWQALISAYENSAYFEYYADYFKPFYEESYKYLFDFNLKLQELVCSLIGIETNVILTDNYLKDIEGIDDFREVIRPKITLPDATFVPQPYYQVFAERNGFLPDASIVDLLFNKGPESLLVIRDSIKSV